jgi:hypothetical protein
VEKYKQKEIFKDLLSIDLHKSMAGVMTSIQGSKSGSENSHIPGIFSTPTPASLGSYL